MSAIENKTGAIYFYQRYNSNLNHGINNIFREKLERVRKYAGPVFENFLLELKKKIDDPSMDICYAISIDEYHAIKERMLNTHSVDAEYFDQFLEDLVSNRLLPKDFDDYEYELSFVEDIPIVFLALESGYIPEGFSLWKQHDNNDRCIAHLATYFNCLPDDFKQLDLRDKHGYSVWQIMNFQRFQHQYNLNT